jgi:TubC N-terminal docking domain
MSLTETDVAEFIAALPEPPPPLFSKLQALTVRQIEALEPEVRLQLEADHRTMIAAREAERDKRRAEIVAQVALRPIDPDPNENCHPALIRDLELEAEAAFRDAKAVLGVALDAERVRMRQQGGGAAGYVASLRAYAVRWKAIAALSPADAALLGSSLPQTPQLTLDPASKIIAAQAAAGIRPAPGVNPRALIAQLAGRGIGLSVVDGKLIASPSGIIDEAGRRQLETHRAAIIECLQSSEVI